MQVKFYSAIKCLLGTCVLKKPCLDGSLKALLPKMLAWIPAVVFKRRKSRVLYLSSGRKKNLVCPPGPAVRMKLCKEHFHIIHSWLPDGRFQVRLPFKKKSETLSNTF